VITVLVTMLISSLMLVIGLVVDGGSARAARSDALDEASSAARAAAQMIDEDALRRDREVVLNPVAARKAAADFVASTGDKADITITEQPAPAPGAVRGRVGGVPPEVTVTVTRTVATQFLWAVGIGSIAESATATVSPEPGSPP
jgi:Flp pilus assembly protein TadG